MLRNPLLNPDLNTYELTFTTDQQRTVRIKDDTQLGAERQLFKMYSALNTTLLQTRKIDKC